MQVKSSKQSKTDMQAKSSKQSKTDMQARSSKQSKIDVQVNSFAMADWELDTYKAVMTAIMVSGCLRMLIGELFELGSALRYGFSFEACGFGSRAVEHLLASTGD